MGSEWLSDVVLAEVVNSVSWVCVGDDTKFDKPGFGRDLVQWSRISGVFHFDGFVLAFRLASKHRVVKMDPARLISVEQIFSTIILQVDRNEESGRVGAFSLDVELQFKLVKIFGVDLKLYGSIPGLLFACKILFVTCDCEGRILDLYQFWGLLGNPETNVSNIVRLKGFGCHKHYTCK